MLSICYLPPSFGDRRILFERNGRPAPYGEDIHLTGCMGWEELRHHPIYEVGWPCKMQNTGSQGWCHLLLFSVALKSQVLASNKHSLLSMEVRPRRHTTRKESLIQKQQDSFV